MYAVRNHLLMPVAVTLLVAASASADVVAVKSRPPLVNTRVVKLQNGKLTCQEESGGQNAFPIDQVEYMQITGWQLFDLAEKQRRAGDWHRAAASYERALADLIAPPQGKVEAGAGYPPSLRKAEGMGHPSGEEGAGRGGAESLDRTLLLECRLIQAADAQGRFERALELYLQVVERMPAVVEALRPTHLPKDGFDWLKGADELIDPVIARHKQDELGRSLAAWKGSWPRPASAPAADLAAPVIGDDPVLRADLDSIAALVNSGRFDDALAQIDAVQKRAHGLLRADLLYWQGRALELAIPAESAMRPAAEIRPAGSLSHTESRSAEFFASVARAGLAYMRVVVHYPTHARVPECLYRAGELCRRSGQNEQARRLWTELMTLYPQTRGPDGTLWAEKAREELKR